jgi:UDP-N-acetylmuramyl pentapeptide phosphotransferase/UDP-N-acetylglucosamine-1-phosphate transferase
VIVLVSFVVGFVAGRLVWVLVRPTLEQPLFARANYRGVEVVVAAGIVLPLTSFAVEAGRAAAGAAGWGDAGLSPARAGVVLAVGGLALLGLFDDLAGAGPGPRGFRGHLLALARGRLTTGGAKLFGGLAVAAVAVAVASPDSSSSLGRFLIDAAVVALAANLGNLFDRGPGRALKVSLLAFVVLAVLTRAAAGLGPVALIVGAGAALLLDDLHERLMLGDTGANVLGGVLGLGVVLSCAPSARAGVAVALAALNLLSEVVSFSRVIGAVPPLRALDHWGRPHR